MAMSHPSRVRGLKWYELAELPPYDLVAPFMGAWIEIFRFLEKTKGKSICRTLRGCVD